MTVPTAVSQHRHACPHCGHAWDCVRPRFQPCNNKAVEHGNPEWPCDLCFGMLRPARNNPKDPS